MSTLDELVPWLREQIAEVRHVALEAMNDRSGVWRHVVTPGGDNKVVDDLGYSVSGHYDIDSEPWWTGPHIARHDPRAVLAQCGAYEALLDAYENAEARRARLVETFTRDLRKIADLGPDEERRRYSEVSKAEGLASGYGMAVLMVASAFQHRPGYRREWTP